jgi:hypothetical protein
MPFTEYIEVAIDDTAIICPFPYDTEVHGLLIVPFVTFDHVIPSFEYIAFPLLETATNLSLPYVTEVQLSTGEFPIYQVRESDEYIVFELETAIKIPFPYVTDDHGAI